MWNATRQQEAEKQYEEDKGLVLVVRWRSRVGMLEVRKFGVLMVRMVEMLMVRRSFGVLAVIGRWRELVVRRKFVGGSKGDISTFPNTGVQSGKSTASPICPTLGI